MKAIRLSFFRHRFTVSGLNLERFINTMQKADMPLLYVRRQERRTLVCECYSADLPAISRLIEEKGWRLSDAEPLMMSKFLHTLRMRPGIPVGVALSLILVTVALQFVWRVEVHGAGAYVADIQSFLTEQGVTPGTPKAELNAQALERILTRRYPDVAWFHVYVYNITLVVDVTQGVTAPNTAPLAAGDLVAQHGGVVTSVQTHAGTALVKPGDVVTKGQVLISGTERAADEQLVPVRARGVVMARCWKSLTVHMPLTDVLSAETGREATATQLCTPFACLPATLETPEFLAYNTYVTVTPVGGSFFPVYQKTAVFKEVSMEYAIRSPEEVKQEAATAAYRELQNALYGYEIVDKWVDYCMIEGDTLAATATAEWLMDIGDKPPS